MVYIFSEYNFGMFMLSVIVTCILWLGCAGYSVQLEANWKKSNPENYKELAVKFDRRLFGSCFLITGIIWIAYIACVISNIPYRTEQLEREAAIVKLADVVSSITERRFGERCAFNGASVDSSWVETDTFPCVTIGDTRIWAKGASLVSRNSVAIRRAFVIGHLQGDQSISRLAEIDFESMRSGILENYPSTATKLKLPEIKALTEALSR